MRKDRSQLAGVVRKAYRASRAHPVFDGGDWEGQGKASGPRTRIPSENTGSLELTGERDASWKEA